MTPDQWAACGYTDAAGNLVNLQAQLSSTPALFTTATIIVGPNVPNTYLYLGLAVGVGLVVLEALKK